MTEHSPQPPEALLRAVARDLRPVKPSSRPLRSAFEVAPLALIVSSLVLFGLGIRGDSGALGPLLTWGASAVQFVSALLLVWVAAHESTPARRLPKQAVYAACFAVSAVFFAITLSTFSASPQGSVFRIAGAARSFPPWIVDLVCGLGSTVAGGLLVLLLSRIFRNSLTVRPALAGAFYGAGAGLAINAGWRIACPYPTLRHALGTHGTAILATILLGTVVGRYLGSRKFHR